MIQRRVSQSEVESSNTHDGSVYSWYIVVATMVPAWIESYTETTGATAVDLAKIVEKERKKKKNMNAGLTKPGLWSVRRKHGKRRGWLGKKVMVVIALASQWRSRR
jgi:hypothetical protein